MSSLCKRSFGGIILFLFFLVVSASLTEKVLKIPLFDFGGIWISSVSKVQTQMCQFLSSLLDFRSVTGYVVLIITLVSSYYLYVLLFAPLNRVRLLGDIGYAPDGKLSMKEIANSVRKRRVVGEIPPVYPNGWFGLIEGFRIKNRESKGISVLGLNLAVFRDEHGSIHVLDAYCPHMGANLAVGGKVVGDCIECPFHGWQFRGHDGKCTKIPYAEKIPDIAKVKSYTCMELNGWIYLWYHAEGAEPYWTPDELPEVKNGNWVYRGRSEHIINAHIEEVPENGADVVHLAQVHQPFMFAGINLLDMWSKKWSFAHHSWTAQWEQLPDPDGHIGSIKLTHKMKIFGFCLPFVDLNVSAKQIGPGIVYLEWESLFGTGVFIQSLLPIEPMVQKLVHNIYCSWYMPTFIAKFFMLGEAIMVERDVMIWNNKQYQGKPLLVKSKEDSLIARHRRWYSQFYSENSPRLSFQKNSLDW